ncbi:cytochrome c [Acetobacteraceae bacterium]|nr:cytochrome c [Acetobacteraceae bacterium]
MKRFIFPIACFFALATFTFSVQAGLASQLKTQIESGRYSALLADCAACHTLKDKPEYSGGLAFAIPTGLIYATNITPDLTYGIGTYTEQEFSKAVREGVRKDGKSLYPAMPYPSYAHLSDKEIHNLYLYFQKAVAPVHQPAPKEKIFWLVNVRWPLTIWRYFFAPSAEKAKAESTPQAKDSLIKRGAYLAEGAGHCGACHTPRGNALQEQTLEEETSHLFLSGGQNMEGWNAPNLRQDSNSGLKDWTQKDLERFLKTGKSTKSHVFGSMTEVIQKSTSYWKDEDIKAISAFLLSLPPINDKENDWAIREEGIQKQHRQFSRGEQIYIDRCASCHGSDGQGYGLSFPPLKKNPIVTSSNTASLIHLLENGGSTPIIPSISPSSFTMPGFSEMLSDIQISEVLTYIRSAWGNHAKPVSVRKVRKIRRNIQKEVLPAAPLN